MVLYAICRMSHKVSIIDSNAFSVIIGRMDTLWPIIVSWRLCAVLAIDNKMGPASIAVLY